MPTNDENKLLRKVLSKWEQIDKNWQVTDTSDCSNMGEEGENPECDEQLCLKHQKMYRTEVVEMIQSEARAEGYKEGQRETITRILMLISRGTLHSVDKAITDVIDYCKNTEEKVD